MPEPVQSPSSHRVTIEAVEVVDDGERFTAHRAECRICYWSTVHFRDRTEAEDARDEHLLANPGERYIDTFPALEEKIIEAFHEAGYQIQLGTKIGGEELAKARLGGERRAFRIVLEWIRDRNRPDPLVTPDPHAPEEDR